jgi:hypothetical protein
VSNLNQSREFKKKEDFETGALLLNLKHWRVLIVPFLFIPTILSIHGKKHRTLDRVVRNASIIYISIGVASARTSGGKRASGQAQSRQINCARQMHCSRRQIQFSAKNKSREKIPSQHQTMLHATW